MAIVTKKAAAERLEAIRRENVKRHQTAAAKTKLRDDIRRATNNRNAQMELDSVGSGERRRRTPRGPKNAIDSPEKSRQKWMEWMAAVADIHLDTWALPSPTLTFRLSHSSRPAMALSVPAGSAPVAPPWATFSISCPILEFAESQWR